MKQMTTTPTLNTVPQIGKFIQQDWENPSIQAKPFLSAMIMAPDSIISIGGASIVKYFLKYSTEYCTDNSEMVKEKLRELIEPQTI